jgi:hypothetical protein
VIESDAPCVVQQGQYAISVLTGSGYFTVVWTWCIITVLLDFLSDILVLIGHIR